MSTLSNKNKTELERLSIIDNATDSLRALARQAGQEFKSPYCATASYAIAQAERSIIATLHPKSNRLTSPSTPPSGR